MIDYARAVGPLEEALVRLDAMLEGLAEGYDEYRSTEELVGGLLAVRDRLHGVWEHVTLRARGAEARFRADHVAGRACPHAAELPDRRAGRAYLRAPAPPDRLSRLP